MISVPIYSTLFIGVTICATKLLKKKKSVKKHIVWPLQDICNLPVDWITVIEFYEVRDRKKTWTILDAQSWKLDAQYTCGSDLLAFVMEDKIWICICFNNPSLALLVALDWSIHPCRIANITYTLECSFLFLMRHFVMSRTEWLF